jgi:hypothetical protein
MIAWLAALDRDSLRFSRPITERVWMVSRSLITIKLVASCAINAPAICYFFSKILLKNRNDALTITINAGTGCFARMASQSSAANQAIIATKDQ